MEKVYHFQMDVFRKMKLPSMVFVSGDTVCGFLIEILSNGEILLLDGLQVKLTSRLPSGKVSTGACQIRGNKAAFCLQSTELEEAGRVIASLQLYRGEERLSTMQFFYTVDESLLSGDVAESESQKRLFDELISDMVALKKVIPADGEIGQILAKTEEGTAWQNVESLKGETGEQGPSGAQGEPGKSAYDLWKESGNEGTLQEFLDSLRGAPGSEGPRGPSGERGETGQSGPQGQAGERGESVYDIWKSEGNSGTKQDFLLSLKGVRGEIGPRGSAGPRGERGEIGKSAYDLWREQDGNALKTMGEFFESLKGSISEEQLSQLSAAVKNGGGVQEIKYEQGKLFIFNGEKWIETKGGGGGVGMEFVNIWPTKIHSPKTFIENYLIAEVVPIA